MLQLRVEAIKQELQDTATFYLSEVSGKKITYNAGQFITLVFDHHHEEIRRSYSLSSSPGEQFLAITVKRITNGEISRFMLTKVKPGDILHAQAPAGRFILNEAANSKTIFLFAAGSGIVPIFSQLKYALAHHNESNFVLIYSNRDGSSILFDKELQELAQNNGDKLTIINLLSSEADRLTNYRVERLVNEYNQNPADAGFYLCGPYDLVTGENQTILQAALQNGIRLPYSCRQGICSTCIATCKSGKVVMTKNEVLTEADLASGLVLTCTGHAVGDDVVIEV